MELFEFYLGKMYVGSVLWALVESELNQGYHFFLLRVYVLIAINLVKLSPPSTREAHIPSDTPYLEGLKGICRIKCLASEGRGSRRR